MDFELEHMSAEFAHEVERLINEEVASERDVLVNQLSREEAEREPGLDTDQDKSAPAEHPAGAHHRHPRAGPAG